MTTFSLDEIHEDGDIIYKISCDVTKNLLIPFNKINYDTNRRGEFACIIGSVLSKRKEDLDYRKRLDFESDIYLFDEIKETHLLEFRNKILNYAKTNGGKDFKEIKVLPRIERVIIFDVPISITKVKFSE